MDGDYNTVVMSIGFRAGMLRFKPQLCRTLGVFPLLSQFLYLYIEIKLYSLLGLNVLITVPVCRKQI